MRAVTFSRFGGPEVLEVLELPEPQPGAGEVRIRVAAATVNPTDILFRAGGMAAALQDLPPPYIPGMDLAGTVDAAGATAHWQPGQQVMAVCNPRRPGGGAQAAYVVVPERSVAPIPAGSSLAAASTLPMNGLTVQRALDLMALQPGQTLAVTGAAGCVGGYAVELGANAGLRVIAVASPADEELVRGFGAAVFVPRGEDAMQRIKKVVPGGVDALIDAALLHEAALPAIRDGGQLAAVRAFEGETERDITIHRVSVGDYLQNQEALADLGRLAGAGKLTLRVAECFPPEQAGEAQRRLDAGGVRGRLVIVF